MRRLARLKPAIDRIIDDQLDETERLGAGGTPVDLAQTFAFPVPFLVICELLGLPAEEREKFRGMASARFDVTGGGDRHGRRGRRLAAVPVRGDRARSARTPAPG